MRYRITLSIMMLALLLAPLNVLPAGAYHEDGTTIHEFADPRFEARWARTDEPVSSGIATRTWIWGPSPYTEGGWETYLGAPDDIRLVQYFDKSRMELTDPDAAGDDIWGVTQGLLALEMMRGEIQVGDAEFIQHVDGPSTENVAGDPGEDNGPTYATMGMMIEEPARSMGTVIDERLHLDGSVTTEPGLADIGVTASNQVTVDWIDHTIASVFWDFMNSEGLVWDGQGYVTDALFLNPYYATGLPVTEAYWTAVRVDGVERDVLAQCFERRCLTYTPDNEDGWQVEAGNVGQHYYRWRQEAGDSFIASPPIEEEEFVEDTPIAAVELDGVTLRFFNAGSDSNDGFVISELVRAGYRGIESVERLHEANALEIFNAVAPPGTAIPGELMDIYGEATMGPQGWALPLPLADTGQPATLPCSVGSVPFNTIQNHITSYGYPYVFLSEADGPASVPAHWQEYTTGDGEPRHRLSGGVNNKSFFVGTVSFCFKQIDGVPLITHDRHVNWDRWPSGTSGPKLTQTDILNDPGDTSNYYFTSNPHHTEYNFRLRIALARDIDQFHIGATWAHPPDTIVWGP
jgi:hypothetical protein